MHKIGVSRPIVAEDSRILLGVLTATVATDLTFGSQNFSDRPRLAALTAREEADGSRAPDAPPRHVVILHAGLRHGQFVPIHHAHVHTVAAAATTSPDALRLPRAPRRSTPNTVTPSATTLPVDGWRRSRRSATPIWS